MNLSVSLQTTLLTDPNPRPHGLGFFFARVFAQPRLRSGFFFVCILVHVPNLVRDSLTDTKPVTTAAGRPKCGFVSAMWYGLCGF